MLLELNGRLLLHDVAPCKSVGAEIFMKELSDLTNATIKL
jgi:hypothetical protein